MNIQELDAEINIMLSALYAQYITVPLGSNLPKAKVIESFGTVVIGLDRRDYSQIISKLVELYPGYRLFFISTEDNILETKDKFIWELMRSGYMRYIRTRFPGAFKQLISFQGYSRKIVNERLKVWDGEARYKYLIEENEEALHQSESYILSVDPSFYDFMPEKPEQ